MSAQIVLTTRQRGGHVVVGRSELTKLRTRVLARHRRAEIAIAPATRRREQRARRPTDEAPRDEQREQQGTDRNPAQQHAATQTGAIDVRHHRGLVEPDRNHQPTSRLRGGNEADDAIGAIDAGQSRDAGLRRRHQGHRIRREPLTDELRMLRAAREDDAVAIGDGEHAAGEEARSGPPEPRQVFRQALEIEAGHQHTAAIRIRRGERQGERQEAAADTGRGRETAGREILGDNGITDPLRPIALGRPSAGSEAQIRLPPASSNATNANIGTLCWVARNRSPQPAVASRTSSNCATAASSVRAPSAMLSTSPFSSCACCSDRSPSCARRSSQSLYSTQAPSTMTGSRQVSTTSNSRVDSRMLWRRPPMSGDARCLGTTRHRSLPIP